MEHHITARKSAHFQRRQGRIIFLFIHSYYVVPEDAGVLAATNGYGIEFTSSIQKDNIFACQFHPEKSQGVGLRLLKNFGAWAGEGKGC